MFVVFLSFGAFTVLTVSSASFLLSALSLVFTHLFVSANSLRVLSCVWPLLITVFLFTPLGSGPGYPHRSIIYAGISRCPALPVMVRYVAVEFLCSCFPC